MTTAKKKIKGSPYKWTPETPLIFYKFFIYYFVEEKGIATTICSLIENKKIPAQKLLDQNNLFPAT